MVYVCDVKENRPRKKGGKDLINKNDKKKKNGGMGTDKRSRLNRFRSSEGDSASTGQRGQEG